MENESLYLDNFRSEIIYNTLFPNGTNSDKINLEKRTVITFAGVPCSGKSTVSREIEKRYGGVRINFDEVMETISKKNLVKNLEQSEQIKSLFAYTLLKNPPFKNKLVILDGSIDRRYETLFKICNENKWDYLIIQLEISKKEATRRINERNPDNLDNWLPRVDKWFKEHEKFKENIKSDILMNGEDLDFEFLFEKLDKKFSE